METQSKSTSFIDDFAAIVRLLTSGEEAEALRLLSLISQAGKPERTEVNRDPKLAIPTDPILPQQRRRTAVPIEEQAAVFARDNYTCRYCGVRTISLQVMTAVSELYPDIYLFHPHWKYEKTDRSFSEYSTSLEHIVPLSRRGKNDRDNLLTTCAWCNYSKNNALASEVGWQIRPISEAQWDGLSSSLGKLLSLLDHRLHNYRRWLKAIELTGRK